MSMRVLARDLLHPVLDRKLPLLQGDFFELFCRGEVVLIGELVKLFVELVVLLDKLAKVIVALEQEGLYLLRFRCIHSRPPL